MLQLSSSLLLAFSVLLPFTQPAVPQPRTYSTHQYYVLNLPPSLSPFPHRTLSDLFPNTTLELVEPFNALPDHYLVRRRKLERLEEEEEEERRVRRSWESRRHAKRHEGWSGAMELIPQTPKRRTKRYYIDEDSSDDDIDLEIRSDAFNVSLVKRAPAPPPSFASQINDPLFPKQWHLLNPTEHGNDLNVLSLWPTVTGKGVTVALIDDGLDIYHDDIKAGYAIGKVGSWDYNDHVPTPLARLADDFHGTRCAGEIAARPNDVCGVGVAWEAGLAAIRILSGDITDADEAMALNHGFQTNAIYSCSWGPPDTGRALGAPSPLIQKAFLTGVQVGRQGLGSIFVFASGNGGTYEDQCNFDGYTNSIWTVTIGALDHKGAHPEYSESCAALMAVAWSSGGGASIFTTDVHKNKCTGGHGGTSAAAPLASGIFALALQVRPDLTWRDIQYLCVVTAVPINPKDPDWDRTASTPRRQFSYKYGYGKLDAVKYVEAARTWQLVKPQGWYQSEVQAQEAEMSENGVVRVIEVTEQNLLDANFDKSATEHVQVTVNIEHERRGNVEVILESPHGVKSVLAKSRRWDEDRDGFKDWTFMTLKHWGENPVGKWKLTVLHKNAKEAKGSFKDWQLMLWGQVMDPTRAKEYKIPEDEDIQLPANPTEAAVEQPTQTQDSSSSTDDQSEEPMPETPEDERPNPVEDEDLGVPLPTKTLVKPADELPADHSIAIGDTDSVFHESDEGDMLPSRQFRIPTWVFALIGLLIVAGGSTAAYFLIDRRRRKAVGDRPYDFDLLPGDEGDDDYEGVEMGRIRLHEEGSQSVIGFERFTQLDDDEHEKIPIPRNIEQQQRHEARSFPR
ncbi:hypothetical protein BT69DRAFT_1219557 [Atractiella rhizophila]|nr:hypothetical protein BT69DRAFT_1219557 [Atractiella rhizophila]